MKTEVVITTKCEGCGSEMKHIWAILSPRVEFEADEIGFDFECDKCNSTTESHLELDFYEGEM